MYLPWKINASSIESAVELFDRQLLVRRRARVTETAQNHDFLLQCAAEDICGRLEAILREFPRALNLGAHHGLLSRALRAVPTVGYIVSAESCPVLLARCDGPLVLCDEEVLPFRGASLDLVVSALALQFVNDLPGALIQIRRALKPDGLFMASLAGGQTLFELREALLMAEEEIEGGASPRVAPFADVRDYGGLLQRAGFAMPVADSETFKVTYNSLFDLMRELRGMGATNILISRSRRPLKRATLFRAAEIYEERFSSEAGRIQATFELITLTGWAPDESQPKPLKPGSARQKLADALGVKEISAGEKVSALKKRESD